MPVVSPPVMAGICAGAMGCEGTADTLAEESSRNTGAGIVAAPGNGGPGGALPTLGIPPDETLRPKRAVAVCDAGESVSFQVFCEGETSTATAPCGLSYMNRVERPARASVRLCAGATSCTIATMAAWSKVALHAESSRTGGTVR